MLFIAPIPAITLPQAPEARPVSGAEELTAILKGFLAERDALLFRPDATATQYRELVLEWAKRLTVGTLSVRELAQSARVGLLDLPPARDAALERLDTLAPASGAATVPPADGACAAVVRLRLLGCVTADGLPEPAEQERLLPVVLAHPGIPEYMKSGGAVVVMDTLCRLGNAATIRKHGARIAEVVRLLDVRAPDAAEIAADLGRIAGLVSLAAKDRAELRSELKALLTFGREAYRAFPERRVDIYEQIDPLESVLNGMQSDKDVTTFEDEKELIKNRSVSLPTWFWGLFRTTHTGGTPLVLPYNMVRPPSQRSVLESPPPRTKTLKTKLAIKDENVLPIPAAGFRTFGGLELDDSFIRLRAADFALDPVKERMYARSLSLDMPPYRLDASRINLSEGGIGTLEDVRVIAYIRHARFLTISSPLAIRDEQGFVGAKDAKVSLFGLRLVTVPLLNFRSTTPKRRDAADLPDPDDFGNLGEGKKTKKPKFEKGQSASSQWLKIPTIGTLEGGISLGYRNAIKFGGRWSIPFSATLNTSAPSSADISVNYNIRSIDNSVDRFTDVAKFEQEFWNSSYFNIKRTNLERENEDLFSRVLLAGVYAQKNQFRTDPDLNRQTINIPLSARLEGGGAWGRTLGYRGQAGWERVDDTANGDDERWLLIGSVGPPSVRLTQGIYGFVRADTGWRYGVQTEQNYGWWRGLAGTTANLKTGLRLSAAYYNSGESGVARYPYDRVPADHGISARTDFSFGSANIAYMNQYSTRLNRWARTQFYVGIRIGGMEPFLGFDQRFNSYSFGLKARMDIFGERFSNRQYATDDAAPESAERGPVPFPGSISGSEPR